VSREFRLLSARTPPVVTRPTRAALDRVSAFLERLTRHT
jgi:hypothetical protein